MDGCFELKAKQQISLQNRLFSVKSNMSIVEFDGPPPSWSLDTSETGESTKWRWVGMVEDTALSP